jgi:hypothetical protein
LIILILMGWSGAEHNTIKIIQATNDNRFYGFVSNLPDTEEGRDFSGIVVGKDVYITHWDSITKAKLSGNGKEFSGINQAFNESDGGIDVKDSITASATAIRLDTDACCDGIDNEGIQGDGIDCGGPCGDCPETE